MFVFVRARVSFYCNCWLFLHRYQEAKDIEPEQEEDKVWKRKYMELISSDKGCCLAKNGRLSEVFGTVHRN